MTLKSFYKDDLLTSSNNIPWLYDLDTCDVGDDTAVTSIVTDENAGDGVSKVRADDSIFSVPLHSPFSQPASRLNDLVQSAEKSREKSFIESFNESLSNSVIEGAHDADTSELLVGDGAAVSKLTRLYVRNVAVLGVATMLSQAPFYGVRSFQSSVNGSSGRWALVVYHAAVTLVVRLVGSAVLSSRFRPKTAVILSVVAGLPFTVVATFRASSDTSVLLAVTAAAAGVATMLMSAMRDSYVTSLGASCAALSNDRPSVGRAAARHFIKVFSQYLLVMQQLSLFLGNFASSSVFLMTNDSSAMLSTSPGR